jgi:hypothetical protein
MEQNNEKVRMVPNPTLTTLIILLSGVLVFIFIMLLPALLELKRPRDAGPRVIIDNTSFIQSQIRASILVADAEGERFDQALINKISEILAVLPSLEA